MLTSTSVKDGGRAQSRTDPAPFATPVVITRSATRSANPTPTPTHGPGPITCTRFSVAGVPLPGFPLARWPHPGDPRPLARRNPLPLRMWTGTGTVPGRATAATTKWSRATGHPTRTADHALTRRSPTAPAADPPIRCAADPPPPTTALTPTALAPAAVSATALPTVAVSAPPTPLNPAVPAGPATAPAQTATIRAPRPLPIRPATLRSSRTRVVPPHQPHPTTPPRTETPCPA